MNDIGVGIVGASPEAGWAALAHVPALRALPGFALRAVATSRWESARAAQSAFGAAAAYVDPGELARDPAVDLVVVSVKVPHHHEVVRAVLAAGKHVLCEWPLGRTLAEAEDLAARAKAARTRSFVGLQARFAPAVRYLRDLVAEGYVGEVLGTTLVGSGEFWGPEIDRAHAYVYDAQQGATVLTVSALHALDALGFVLGEPASVSATVATRQTRVRIAGEDATLVPTAPDQVALHGTLASGAVLSAFYRGGRSRGDNLRWEINGSAGDLVLTSPSGYLQVGPLRIEGGRGADAVVHALPVPAGYEIAGLPPGPPVHVGHLYAAIARDLREGTHEVPDFDHAVKRHRLIDAVLAGARTGAAQPVS